jgi:D-alanine-D-alanine ligase
MIDVDPQWWKYIFDEAYLVTDARSVGNQEQTRKEVDFLEEVAELNKMKDGRILDLCGGQGRHSLELIRRGYTRVTVVDYSEYLLSFGLQIAKDQNLNLRVVRGNACEPSLKRGIFRAVMILGGSFGYFAKEKDDLKLLFETKELLTPGGFVLIDLPEKNYVKENFKPESRHIEGEFEIVRTRELVDDVIKAQEDIYRQGQEKPFDQKTYSIRLYSEEEIMDLFIDLSFNEILFLDKIDRSEEGDFGTMTNRMVVKAIK